MIFQLQLPTHAEALVFNRKRWDEVLEDQELGNLSSRIETNAFGQIIMSPPPELTHGRRQFRIGQLLETALPGCVVTECPIITRDGVKVADVAWFSQARYETVRGQKAVEVAPEICVEVLSVSNTQEQMRIKRELYFDAGAVECWICDLEGHMAYYHHQSPDPPMPHSQSCPDFPNPIANN